MTTQVPTVPTFPGPLADLDDPSTFNERAEPQFTYIATMQPDLNASIEAINTLGDEIEVIGDSAASNAAIALGAAQTAEQTVIGDYLDGNLTFNLRGEVVNYVANGYLYKPKSTVALPYTTNISTYTSPADDPNLSVILNTNSSLQLVAISLNTPIETVSVLEVGGIVTKYLFDADTALTYSAPDEVIGTEILSATWTGSVWSIYTVGFDDVILTLVTTANTASRSISGSELGLVYDDLSSASSNFTKLASIVDDDVTLFIDGNVHLACIETPVSGRVRLYQREGTKLILTGTKAFKLETGAVWIEQGTTKELASGLSLQWLLNEHDAYIPFMQFSNTKWSGDIFNFFYSNHELNPFVTQHGFGEVRFDGLTISDTFSNFWSSRSLPYNLLTVTGVEVRNFGYSVFNTTIENSHPYHDNIKESMKIMKVSDATVSSSDSRFGDDPGGQVTSSLHTFVAWEGRTLHYNDIEVSELKTRTAVSCYDVYLGGDNFYSSNVNVKNVWAFNMPYPAYTEPNTCLKIKNARICHVDNRNFTYDDDFFTRVLTDFDLEATSSHGEFVTYTGNTKATSWRVSNSKFTLPVLNARDIPNRLIQSFVLNNVDMTSFGEGQVNLFNVLWDDTNSSINRTVKMRGCTMFCPNANVKLLDLGLGNQRAGMNVDISDNIITAKDLTDIQIVQAGTFDIKDATIEGINLNNSCYVYGTYSQFTSFNRAPKVLTMDANTKVRQGAYSGSGLVLPYSATGVGSLQGKYKHSFVSGFTTMTLWASLAPDISFVEDGTYHFSGKIYDDNIVSNVSIFFKVSNITGSQFDIEYIRNDDARLTLTWSGSGSSVLLAHGDHPTLAATLVRLSASVSIKLTGLSGSATVDLNYSMV